MIRSSSWPECCLRQPALNVAMKQQQNQIRRIAVIGGGIAGPVRRLGLHQPRQQRQEQRGTGKTRKKPDARMGQIDLRNGAMTIATLPVRCNGAKAGQGPYGGIPVKRGAEGGGSLTRRGGGLLRRDIGAGRHQQPFADPGQGQRRRAMRPKQIAPSVDLDGRTGSPGLDRQRLHLGQRLLRGAKPRDAGSA